jgi:hypothetical protein
MLTYSERGNGMTCEEFFRQLDERSNKFDLLCHPC